MRITTANPVDEKRPKIITLSKSQLNHNRATSYNYNAKHTKAGQQTDEEIVKAKGPQTQNKKVIVLGVAKQTSASKQSNYYDATASSMLKVTK